MREAGGPMQANTCSLVMPTAHAEPSRISAYRSGRSPDWLKMKNPDAQAVKREAEEDWRK